MKRGMFMDIVSVHYKDIKNLFKSRSINKGEHFDEDSFNDAFIKCAQRFGYEQIDYDTAIKYFWVAYVNTVKMNSVKMHNDIKDELDMTMHDCIDDDEPTKAQYVYDTVMNAITEAFSEEDMMIYSLYKYHNWTEKELTDADYDCKNLDIRIKNIHRFVKEYCKKHIKSL